MIWDARSCREVRRLLDVDAGALAIAALQGDTIVAIDGRGALGWWNASSGAKLRSHRVRPGMHTLRMLVPFPRGDAVAAVSSSGVGLWTPGAELVRTLFAATPDWTWRAAASPGGDMVVTRGAFGLTIFDGATGEKLYILPDRGRVSAVAIGLGRASDRRDFGRDGASWREVPRFR